MGRICCRIRVELAQIANKTLAFTTVCKVHKKAHIFCNLLIRREFHKIQTEILMSFI